MGVHKTAWGGGRKDRDDAHVRERQTQRDRGRERGGQREGGREREGERHYLCCAFTGADRVPWGNTRLVFADRMLSNHLSRSLILLSLVVTAVVTSIA